MNGSQCEEEAAGLAAVFYLELLIKVILQNRDRISPFWQSIRDHLYSLIVNANENTFLVERAVVGLLRLAIRLLRREEIASQVCSTFLYPQWLGVTKWLKSSTPFSLGAVVHLA